MFSPTTLLTSRELTEAASEERKALRRELMIIVEAEAVSTDNVETDISATPSVLTDATVAVKELVAS